ncbi:diguanylate cyclase (GGDEF)-like protein/putative nucleotidyltransferase with HDIG domain/PAS domain S-box-containing protein [Desulfofundulus luciae]|uniref:Diguanylate cyclase (GGDEF)-like protein/putative nucleotidyltransferase with HDIG domain/PAS domain S-box-containing protein n=1 Tax=Desulfofundulus luciae TaxID=74702 RepID=A0ABU0AXU8_9FIRM|nr:diguanylate cyclase (GGDEF)-like protein/putative nucleotidyltransferase with HDIG domain/PAS domain S-box-containing protein [Desulfofundulus luciae]
MLKMPYDEKLLSSLESIITGDPIADTLYLALKHKYYSVYCHCVNVSCCTYLLATKMGLPEQECLRLTLGALLHDIGKINISPKILYKPGKLNKEEWSVIKRHPVNGINLLNDSKLFHMVADAIRYHHERYDGSGYLEGLSGEDIPLSARIVSIGDCFDALVSFRPYKKILSFEEAIEELIKSKNTHLDGRLVDMFISIAPDFYKHHYHPTYFPLSVENSNKNYSKFIINEDSELEINWEEILDQLPDIGIILIDRDDRILFCNNFAAKLRDVEPGELIGKTIIDIQRPHRRIVVKEKLAKVKSGQANGWERLMARKGRYIENKYIKIADEKGCYSGMLMLTMDVTQREKLLRMLLINLEKLSILAQANIFLKKVFDLEDTLNNTAALISKVLTLEKLWLVIMRNGEINCFQEGEQPLNDNQREELIKKCEKLVQNGLQEVIIEKWAGSKRIFIFLESGDEFKGFLVVETKGTVHIGQQEQDLLKVIGNYVAYAIKNYYLYRELENLAMKDQLTRVYNRQYLNLIKNNLNVQSKFALIVVDIDRLKYINDNFGHQMGDLIIKGTADILKQSIRQSDWIIRMGGDEFLIIVTDCNEAEVLKIINRIKGKVAAWEHPIAGLSLSVSVGYAMSKRGLSFDEIFTLADNNMYEQKRGYTRLF